MIRFRSVTSLSLAFLISGVLLGCGGETVGESDWAVEKGAVEFAETLRLGDDEDYFFAEIRDLTAGPQGRIFVAEGEAARVTVLTSDGTLQDSIGRKG